MGMSELDRLDLPTRHPPKLLPRLAAAGLVMLLFSGPLVAEDAGADPTAVGLDTVWVLVAAFLVFFMQAGFGMVEAGFIRAKNTCNILTKNFVDYCSASIMLRDVVEVTHDFEIRDLGR